MEKRGKQMTLTRGMTIIVKLLGKPRAQVPSHMSHSGGTATCNKLMTMTEVKTTAAAAAERQTGR